MNNPQAPQVGELLFVYGTLRPEERASDLLYNRSRYLKESQIPGALLYTNGSFPGLVLTGDRSKIVIGDVFEIIHSTLVSHLDRYEGYPTLYDRKQIYTTDNLLVWVYVYNLDTSKMILIPSGDWKKRNELTAFALTSMSLS